MFGLICGFSVYGLIIFVLPLVVNIIFGFLPPSQAPAAQKSGHPLLEIIEQASRICYLLAICLLVSQTEVSFSSPFFYAAVFFFVLYHAAWLRYFICGRKLIHLSAPFLFVPLPLSVFPVLYFLSAAIWLNNPIAFAVMIVFGVSHTLVTYFSSRAALKPDEK